MYSPIAARLSVFRWVEKEFCDLSLGDSRRNSRLKSMLKGMFATPSGTLPRVSGGKAGLKANYRLLHNGSIKFARVLRCHAEKTVERINREAERWESARLRADEPMVVLAVQDTTQIDLSAHPKTRGLGVLQGLHHLGMLLHTTMAVLENGDALGILDQQQIVRDAAEFGKKHDRKKRAIANKESNKWLKGVMATKLLAHLLSDVLLVHVADREADIYDLFALARPERQHLLIRACHNRTLVEEELKLWPLLKQQTPLGTMVVNIPGGHGKKARQARMALQSTPVTLHGRTKAAPLVTLWAVLAREEVEEGREKEKEEKGEKKSEKPLEWMLLSTLPVEGLADGERCVRWYSQRWKVETFHRILKSGCNVEECRLGDIESLKRYITLQSIVACRVLYCTTVGRSHPERPCTDILSKDEWTVLYCITHQTRHAPKEPPMLGEAVVWIARLAGFLARKSDGHPGAQLVQQGFQRLTDLTQGYAILNRHEGFVGN